MVLILCGGNFVVGVELDVMKFVVVVYSKWFLKNFEEVLNVYKEQLEEDLIVYCYLFLLYDILLEQNLC